MINNIADKVEVKGLSGESLNILEEKINKIKEIFPEAICEGKIDFERLSEELGEFKEDKEERYRFEWAGKNEAIKIAQTPSLGTLRPCKEESKNWDTTQNLYIEGDNLEVLKLLQKSYQNKVKMIYIDPPYNTGKDFVYKDNFKDNIKNYLEITGQKDTENNEIFTNTESSGRYHSNWLSMIYPRLEVAKNLLEEDGVVFISIDDSELINLKKVCDEVLGEENFIANIIRNTNSSKNQSLFVSVSNDYCLIYAKNIEVLQKKHSDNKWSVFKNNIKEYIKKVSELKELGLSNDTITNELKQLTKYPRFIDFTNYWYFDDKGLYRKDNLGGVKNGNMQVIINPKTGREESIPPGGFRYNSETMNRLINDNRIHFHEDGSLPVLKRYLSENMKQRPKSIMSDDQRRDYSLLKEFGIPFDNPKQLDFMKRIISIFDKDFLCLDFFSGSATTAHAIMELNKEDGGERKFILIQIPEMINEKSEAYKKGFYNICEIGKERIRRAGNKIVSENKDKEGIEDLDIGFKVFKLDSTNVKKWDSSNEQNLHEQLSYMKDSFIEGRTEEDILYELMLKAGIDITYDVEEIKVNDKKIFNIGAGELIVCLSDVIDVSIANEIVKHKNERTRVIFKESGFENDSTKINVLNVLERNKIIEVMSV